MRIRRLLLAGVLAGTVVLALAAPASAEDPGKKAGRELVACVNKALRDHRSEINHGSYDGFTTALDDCHKAKSIITPALPEIIWGTLAFAIVAFVLMKYAFPAIKKSLADREAKIRDDLEKAERSRRDAEEERARYEAQLAEARSEGNRIVEEARQAAEQVRRDLLTRAEADAGEVRVRAQEDVRLANERAMSDLQHRVAELSIELAEKIVERNLDHDTQLALVESYIGSIGNGQR